MKTLPVSTLPSLRIEEPTGIQLMERNGFVDDEVALDVVAGPSSARTGASHADLALSADDMDFAGWYLSDSLPEHATRAASQGTVRRATPPELIEPGLGAPHYGNHRWWLAGLAGGLSTLFFSVLLLTLSSRNDRTEPQQSAPRLTSSPTTSAVHRENSAKTPELTSMPK